MPIQAYSFDNIFDENLPVQVDYLLNVYKNDIDSAINNNINPLRSLANN